MSYVGILPLLCASHLPRALTDYSVCTLHSTPVMGESRVGNVFDPCHDSSGQNSVSRTLSYQLLITVLSILLQRQAQLSRP